MIKRIELTNFQGHRHTVLDLVPGINIIVGVSCSGKSSILRGLWWLMHNRPGGAGERFRHRGADEKAEVSASVSLQDGPANAHTVKRYRKGSDNGYVVDGETLKAIRQDVPTEVGSLLNLADYNFQRQHPSLTVPGSSPIFLLADSPSEVAKRLNEVCKLEIIDGCLRTANTIALRIGQDYRASQEAIAHHGEDLKRYAQLDAMDSALTAAETKNDLRQMTAAKAKALAEDCKALERVNTALEITAVLLAAEADPIWTAAWEKSNRLSANWTDWDDLNGLIHVLQTTETGLTQNTGLAGAEAAVSRSLNVAARLDTIGHDSALLRGMIGTHTLLDTDIQTREVELESLESEFHQLLTDEGVCPLCGKATAK